jgi:hypothetical protein
MEAARVRVGEPGDGSGAGSRWEPAPPVLHPDAGWPSCGYRKFGLLFFSTAGSWKHRTLP